MIDGWLAAETDEAAKIPQLKIWIQEENQAKRKQEELRLRKIRAAIAQKTGDTGVVVEEMTALAQAEPAAAKKREALYQIAYAHYTANNFDAALPEFQKLAHLDSGAPDDLAIQSEHLALDILAKKKAFGEALSQARLWTKDARFAGWIRSLPNHASELEDLKKVEIGGVRMGGIAWNQRPGARDFSARLRSQCLNTAILLQRASVGGETWQRSGFDRRFEKDREKRRIGRRTGSFR